ncbi:MAG TPA: zinc ribbon domain-containing protein [Anaerolineae bacterium]|nr:zinc ribbon domain-containing protein [Anaerolineae bacterium]
MNATSSGYVGRLVLAALAFACLAAPSSSAQTPGTSMETTLASLSVALWPEYDAPEMLVICWGELAADVSLPTTVEWRIPAAAERPSALAADDPERGLINLDFETRQEGEWLVVSFLLDSSGFQIEYYAPLAQSGDERSYVFTYPANYAVTAFSLSAQQPRTARAFTLDPPATSVSTGTDGLTYHEVAVGSLAQGGPESWVIRYLKSDESLSSGARSSAPTTPLPATVGQGAGSSTAWIFLIAFIAVVAVGAGAFWLGRRSGPSPVDGGEVDASFCHSCGARVPRDARYCPKCSAAVRGR